MENPIPPAQMALRRRYKRMMAWMVLVTIAAVAGSIAFLYATVGQLPIHMVIATVVGVGFSVLLGSALMLLSFISNASGHDAEVNTPDE
jgi:hypothetical protein